MSDIKLQQGSDYHGNGKLYFKRDIYREKFPKGSNWKESDCNKHGVEIIGMDIRKHKQALVKITKLEKDLEYARECNNVKDKFWDKIRVERNGFALEIIKLQDKVKELETELYFCNRNTRIKEIVDSGNNICFETHECNYVYKCISPITKEIVDEQNSK